MADSAIDAALIEDRSWLSIDDPIKSLEALGKIISKYEEPGSGEYMSSFLSAANMGSRSHQDINGGVGTLANFLNKNITYEQGKQLGINTLAAGIGSEGGLGYSLSPSGELIRPDDPYVRDANMNIVRDASGNPKRRPEVGDIINPTTGEVEDFSKLEFVPEYMSGSNLSNEYIRAGIVAGAKITPEMLADLAAIKAVTGKGTSVPPWRSLREIREGIEAPYTLRNTSANISSNPWPSGSGNGYSNREPVRTAPIDTILFDSEDTLPIEIMTDLIFENIGGQELINIARNDTINGQDVVYQPIKNLTQIQRQYNPNNILKLQDTSDTYFENFPIRFEEKVPYLGSGPSGAHIYIETSTGDLIVESVGTANDEQIEIEITVSGTIYEAVI